MQIETYIVSKVGRKKECGAQLNRFTIYLTDEFYPFIVHLQRGVAPDGMSRRANGQYVCVDLSCLMHALLDFYGRIFLSSNEILVFNFTSILFQFFFSLSL